MVGPDGSASERDDAPIVGIDLGTTRSVIAYVDDTGRAVTVPNREGDLTTPSAVLFEHDSVTVGKEAVKALTVMPDQVARFAKREMGNHLYSSAMEGYAYSPEMIQAQILGQLRRDAETKLGREIRRAVITVPAYFNEPKRRSTIEAGALAGLDVKAVINEPTAAAIAFGLNKENSISQQELALVYDLGGGTFDASIVRIDSGRIEVVATDGNTMLGGLDWDQCLASWLEAEFSRKSGIRLSESAEGKVFLQRESEELKHSLTSRGKVKIRMSYEGNVLKTSITRDEFEDITAHLLDRTRFTVRKLLSDAGLSWLSIDRIILVGGSTRMPQVDGLLRKESGLTADASVSPDEAVAHGAAIYGATLTSGHPMSTKFDIVDVNSHNLGVLGVETETGLRSNYVMIARNTPLPTKHVARFETARDNQSSVVVEVIEGGDPRGRQSTWIGRCVVRDLPSNLPAGTPVDVEFQYDTDGLIHVRAIHPESGKEATLVIHRSRDVAPHQ